MMKGPRQGRFWLLIAALYIAISLALLDKNAAQTVERQSSHPPIVAQNITTYPNRLSVAASQSNRQELRFTIPSSFDELQSTVQYNLLLVPKTKLSGCTVQVIAECDNHFSFAHNYRPAEIHTSGMPFEIPLRTSGAYWAPIGNNAVWSSWETLGLRKIEVKVFSLKPIDAALELQYEAVKLPEDARLSLAWAQPMAEPIRLGERFELAFDLNGWRGNYFNYEEAGLKLSVVAPDGGKKDILPFLYQDFEMIQRPDKEEFLPRGPKHLRARFRPFAEGDYSYTLSHKTGEAAEETLAQGHFTVLPGQTPHLIRISKKNPRYFEFDDGRFFYPIGWNTAYPVDDPYGYKYVSYLPDGQRLTTMKKLLDDVADSCGNYARFWMTQWWGDIEWNKTTDNFLGPGRYNLKNAWVIDQIVEQCERRGIYLNFTTLNHMRVKHDTGWQTNPFAAHDGGWLTNPSQFWTDPKVRPFIKRRSAYIIARYADSPAIHSWDFMSEIDWAESDGVWATARKVMAEQLRAIKALDPYGHIVSNHLCHFDTDYTFFKLPEVEFIHSNAYADLLGLSTDQAKAIREYAELFRTANKPVIASEYAGNWAGDPGYKMKRDTISGLWGGVASRLSGVPLTWWFNFQYGEDLGKYFKVAAQFMAGEDLIAEDAPEKGNWRDKKATVRCGSGIAEAIMIGNKQKRFLYLYNFESMCRTVLLPNACKDIAVTFSDMDPGAYVVEYWDTQTGKTNRDQELTVGESRQASIIPPDMERDWAIKIRPRMENEAIPVAIATSEPHTSTAHLLESTHAESADWRWQVTPNAEVFYPQAAQRCVYDIRIALPEQLFNRGPDVLDANGNRAPCEWEWLDNGRGWLIRIAGTAKGPFRISAADKIVPYNWTFDESNVGLLVGVVQRDGVRHFRQENDYDASFANPAVIKSVRVPILDQVENPAGAKQDFFVARYEGPMLVDAGGNWGFAINSDDGAFLRVNGKRVVEWIEPHFPEMNKPNFNLWQHNGEMRLKPGIHWVQLMHQEVQGSQIARVGWRRPATGAGPVDLAFSCTVGKWEVPPDWAMDGRIPFTLDVVRDGKIAAVIAPSQGLKLRRPETPVYVAALGAEGEPPRMRLFADEGYKLIKVGASEVPVWVHNYHLRPFSLEVDQGRTREGTRFIESMTYDVSLPLSMTIANNDRGSREHEPRTEVVWDLGPADNGVDYVLALGGVKLIQGRVEEWTPVIKQNGTLPANLSFTELLAPEVELARETIPATLLAPAYAGPQNGDVAVMRLPFDIWSQPPEALKASIRPGTGVLLTLDRMPILKGVSTDEMRDCLAGFITVIRQAGGSPVLALNPPKDADSRLARAQSQVFMESAREWGCPLVDLRERARHE